MEKRQHPASLVICQSGDELARSGSRPICGRLSILTIRGLFYMLGEEEKKIRKNPEAQATALLKEVFGKKL